MHLRLTAAVTAVDTLLERKKATPAHSRPQISKVPESSVLAQLRTFLPQMQSANERLSQQPAAEPAVFISDMQAEPAAAMLEEDVEEGAAQHVQMDIACGVVDLKDAAALRVAENVVNGTRNYARNDDSGSSSVSDSDSNSDDDENDKTDDTVPELSAAPAANSASRQSEMSSGRTPGEGNSLSAAPGSLSVQTKHRQPKILEL